MNPHVNPVWRRPSGCSLGDCVEVADLPGGCVGVRSSKAPALFLIFTADEWDAFLAGVRAGEFDPATDRCVDCGAPATTRVFEDMVPNPDDPAEHVPVTFAVCEGCRARKTGDVA